MKWIGLDTETTGLDWTREKLRCLCFWTDPSDKGSLTNVDEIKQFFNDHREDFFVWQNGAFDQKVLCKATGLWVENHFDTMLGASLLPDRPDGLDLQSIACQFLNVPPWKESHMYNNMDTMPIEQVMGLCLVDCEYTVRSAKIIYEQLIKCQQDQFFFNIKMPTANLLALASYYGVGLDEKKLEEYHDNILLQRDGHVISMYTQHSTLTAEYEQMQLEKDMPKYPTIPHRA